MPRIPTRDSLRNRAPRAAGGIVRAPRDFVGPALADAGDRLSAQARNAAEREKDQQTALELAKARSEISTALIMGKNAFTLDQNPDYQDWERKFSSRSAVWKKRAAAHISDPHIRRQFLHEIEDDVIRVGAGIASDAREIGKRARLADAETSISQLVNNAASVEDEEDAKGTMADVRATLQGLVDAGIMTREGAAKRSVGYAHRYARVKIEQDIQSDPIRAYQNLSGTVAGPAPDYYKLANAGDRVRLTRAAERLADNQIDELDKERRT